MSEVKLLPCPFCGGAAIERKFGGLRQALCGDVDCSAKIDWMPWNIWNARHSPWVPIRSVEDLPKEDTSCVWVKRNTTELLLKPFSLSQFAPHEVGEKTKAGYLKHHVHSYGAYMPIPPYNASDETEVPQTTQTSTST